MCEKAVRRALVHGMLVFAMCVGPVSCGVAEEAFELVSFGTEDGGRIEGALFAAEGGMAAVLAHGAVFDKESWYALSERLQTAGVSALPIDFRGYGKSTAANVSDKHLDVLGAIAFLEAKGYVRIAVIGGSMGGGATLRALTMKTSPAVTKAVLLAPAGGDPIMSGSIDKLFLVAEGDGLAGRVRKIHEASAEPKALHVYAGNAHAQHLFRTEHAENLTQRIVAFVKD